MLTAALALFRAAPILWQIGIVAGVLGALGAGYGVWHHQVYESGYDAAIADVQAANAEGVHNAAELIKTRRACAGTWSQSRGVCEE